MKKIILIFLITTINSLLCNKNENFRLLIYDEDEKEEPGLSKTISIKYFQKKILSFKNDIESDLLQVNIHSINCNIKVEQEEKIKYKANLNIYTITINATNENITIEPIPDQVNGEYKEKYEAKNCYLSLNSYYLNNLQQKLKIKNNDENIIYFNHPKYDLFQISYEIKNIANDSFFSLNLRFEDTPYSINISYYIDNTRINSISKQINNSTNIYLNSDFLSDNKKNSFIGKNGIININITYNGEDESSIMHYKIIEKNTVCLLEKNALNFGFLTTNTTYQYYYTEVFNLEEGELILHNKRFYGELYGKIIKKNEIDEKDLSNPSIYNKLYPNQSLLEYKYIKLF